MNKLSTICLPALIKSPLNRLFILLTVTSFLSAACILAIPPFSAAETPQPASQPLSILKTVTPDLTATQQALPLPPSETPSASGLTPSHEACAFNWASKNLPELSEQFNVKLKEAGLPVSVASAEAFGEDCLYSDGSSAYFAVMETDYRITLAVSDLNDPATLGGLLLQVLAVIDQFPVGATPGPNAGYIGITYQSGDQIENLWFQRYRSDELRAKNITGADLYQALKNK